MKQGDDEDYEDDDDEKEQKGAGQGGKGGGKPPAKKPGRKEGPRFDTSAYRTHYAPIILTISHEGAQKKFLGLHPELLNSQSAHHMPCVCVVCGKPFEHSSWVKHKECPKWEGVEMETTSAELEEGNVAAM